MEFERVEMSGWLVALASDRAGERRTERLGQLVTPGQLQVRPRAETAKPRAEMSDAFLQLAESPEPETRTENEKSMARSSHPRPRRFAHPKKFAKAARGPRPTDRPAAYSEFAPPEFVARDRSEAVVAPKGWNWPWVGGVPAPRARATLEFASVSAQSHRRTCTPRPRPRPRPLSSIFRPLRLAAPLTSHIRAPRHTCASAREQGLTSTYGAPSSSSIQHVPGPMWGN